MKEEKDYLISTCGAGRVGKINYTDFINDDYDESQFELKTDMYSQALAIYFENSDNCDRMSLSMLLWTLLMDNVSLINKKNLNKEMGYFYDANSVLIDYCIEKILRETKVQLGNIIYLTGWKHLPAERDIMDLRYTVVWNVFGEGICMTSWAITYSSAERIAEDINGYCQRQSIKFVLKRQ